MNDDWVYARIAKRFAETGVFRLDPPTQANVFGQALLAAPFVRLLGFSHVGLRLLTMLVSVAGLLAMDRLLGLAGVGRAVRRLAGVLLVLNPFFLYFSTTFMTETYGWVLALLVAVLWFRDLSRLPGATRESDELPRPSTLFVCAALSGLCFWTRQYCAAVFPALAASTLVPLAMRRSWPRVRQALARLALPSALLGALCAGFFLWSRAQGEKLNPYLAAQLGGVGHFEAKPFAVESVIALVYMTAFLLPLLALFTWQGMAGKRTLATGGALLALPAWLHFRALPALAAPGIVTVRFLHRNFPYLCNVLYPGGVGPVTLDDVYAWHADPPQLPHGVWRAVELGLVVGGLLWAPGLHGLRKLLAGERGLRQQVAWFGLILAVGEFCGAEQIAKYLFFDRYLFPVFLGLLLVGCVALEVNRAPAPLPVPRYRWALSLICLVPLVVYAVGGVHDEFRWNDARWALVHEALEAGAEPLNIQGGYEVDGWLSYEARTAGRTPAHCMGPCRCVRVGFPCVDDSFRIGMYPLPEFSVVRSVDPGYWLLSGPPVLLLARQQHPP